METAISSTFGEIAALLALAAATGFVGLVLRQPLIVSFILVGLIAGPSALDLVHSDAEITLLSELGIVMLLFLVGIKLDLALIRSLGAVSLITGLGQVAFTALVSYAIGLALGFDPVTNFYIAAALAFSSTIIIVKLLSDKREIDSLHGKIALGILIVQDLIVVIAMISLSAVGISVGTGEHSGATVQSLLISSVVLVLFVVGFVHYLATPLAEKLAFAPELLVLFAISLAAIFAAVGDITGLGKEVGGLLAGVALASTPYRETIAARLAPLRDFLLLFFFIALGAGIDLSTLGGNALYAVMLAMFVLIGKPLIVLIVMGAMGYRKRTGFLTGMTLAQISEFSLILVTMGVSLGHVNRETLGLVTLVGLVTIAVSTYMITYSHQLYSLCESLLSRFERTGTPREPHESGTHHTTSYPIILFGLGRFGTAIGLRLHQRGIKTLGIDFDPAAVNRWRELGLEAEFGDATDSELMSELPLSQAKWLVSTVSPHPTGLSHEDARITLIQIARVAGFKGKIAVTSHDPDEMATMRKAGADWVIEPFQDAADRAVDALSDISPK
jgi:Kef-type K+ transport system membrane component KefB